MSPRPGPAQYAPPRVPTPGCVTVATGLCHLRDRVVPGCVVSPREHPKAAPTVPPGRPRAPRLSLTCSTHAVLPIPPARQLARSGRARRGLRARCPCRISGLDPELRSSGAGAKAPPLVSLKMEPSRSAPRRLSAGPGGRGGVCEVGG